MKIAGIIAVIIIIFVIFFLVFLSFFGLFAPVKIIEKSMGPYLMVYKKHTGDYKNVGPIMDKLYYDLKDNFNIETTKGFGLYYDNPQEVETTKLRSIVGCIVENKTIEELTVLSNKYGVKEFPVSKSIVSEFPYKGKLSIFLGIFKVYPRLSAFIKENKHPQTPIMELYDQPNRKIEYISAVSLPKEAYDEFLK